MNMNKTHGVYAIQREPYLLPGEAETLLQKVKRALWQHPAILLFLTVGMSVMDAFVLYSIMDEAMVQSEWMGKLVAFGIALVLNAIPLVDAKYVHQAIYGLKRYAAVFAIVGAFTFALLFGGTVWLRFAYQDMYEPSTSSMLVNTVDDGAAQDAEDDGTAQKKSLAVVVLLSIEPLATSLASFVLSYLSDDELEAQINRLRMRRIELKEANSDLKAALACMEQEEQDWLALDEDRYRTAQAAIHAHCELLRAQARLYLAEYLADPAATSRLTADQNGDAEERGTPGVRTADSGPDNAPNLEVQPA